MITQKIIARTDSLKLDKIISRYGEDSMRKVVFIIVRPDPESDDLIPITIPEDAVGSFRILKPSGNFVIVPMSKSVLATGETAFDVVLPASANTAKGSGYYDIRITSDTDKYYFTAQGDFLIDDNIISDEVLEDVSEVNGLIFPDDFLTVEDHVAIIDDDTLSTDSTWSSDKISEEIETHAGGDVSKTVSGNPVTFTDGASAPLVKCVTEIQGSQDLHGYDKPWVGGAGKNLLLITTTSQTVNGITFTVNSDGTIKAVGTATARTALALATNDSETPLLNKSVIMNGCPSGGSTSTYFLQWYGFDGASASVNDIGSGTSAFTPTSTAGSIAIVIQNGVTVDMTFKPMVRLASVSDATFAPYSNICPITAYTEGEIEVNDGDGNTTTHTTTYPSAIYRGSEDCVNGTAEIVKPCYLLSDFTWYYVAQQQRFYTTGVPFKASAARKGWILSSAYEAITDGRAVENIPDCSIYTSGQSTGTLYIQDSRYSDPTDLVTNMGNTQICYELATPTTSSVTPTNLPIKSLSGYTHIESSTGEMEVEYITERFQPLIDSIKQL